MPLNKLHSDVAERPENLIVYGGRVKAARNQESLSLKKFNTMTQSWPWLALQMPDMILQKIPPKI